jgi:hypothetical protein
LGITKREEESASHEICTIYMIHGFLYEIGLEYMLRRCVLGHERESIIEEALSGPIRGHYNADIIARKFLQARLWWSTLNKYCRTQINKCDNCQRIG